MRGLIILAVLCIGLAALLGGGAPFGRILMAVGQPQLAAHLFRDPAWQGAAHYRSGAHGEAATRWQTARAHFNRGNALVRLEEYAAALEAYDLAIAGGDQDARTNFDLVASYYAGLGLGAEALALIPKRKEGPSMEAEIARGDARAAGTGDQVTNASTMMGLAELDSRGRLGVRRIFDDTYILADERWLNQLEDVPGAFLKARISHAHKARMKAGLSPPEPEDPR